MLKSLQKDTSKWRDSDDYQRRRSKNLPAPITQRFVLTTKGYSESRIHYDRTRGASGNSDQRGSSTRYDSHRSGANAAVFVTPPIAVPQRPAMPKRNSSISGSMMDSLPGSPTSTFGSPSWQNDQGYSPYSSRRPSTISQTMSSSGDDPFGIDGQFGFAMGRR